jgi:hypothetical protein
MAQAVRYRSLAAEARVRSQAILCGIYGGQSGTGTGFLLFLLVIRLSSVSIIQPLLHIHPLVCNRRRMI